MASGSDQLNSHVFGLKWNHGSDSPVVSRGINRGPKHSLRSEVL